MGTYHTLIPTSVVATTLVMSNGMGMTSARDGEMFMCALWARRDHTASRIVPTIRALMISTRKPCIAYPPQMNKYSPTLPVMHTNSALLASRLSGHKTHARHPTIASLITYCKSHVSEFALVHNFSLDKQ